MGQAAAPRTRVREMISQKRCAYSTGVGAPFAGSVAQMIRPSMDGPAPRKARAAARPVRISVAPYAGKAWPSRPILHRGYQKIHSANPAMLAVAVRRWVVYRCGSKQGFLPAQPARNRLEPPA